MISGISAEDFLVKLVQSVSGTRAYPFTFADPDTGLLWEITITSNKILIEKIRGDYKEIEAVDSDEKLMNREITDEMPSPCRSPTAEGRAKMPHISLYGFSTSRYLHN